MAVNLPRVDSWFRLMKLHQGDLVICVTCTYGSEMLSQNQKFQAARISDYFIQNDYFFYWFAEIQMVQGSRHMGNRRCDG